MSTAASGCWFKSKTKVTVNLGLTHVEGFFCHKATKINVLGLRAEEK